ncbi:MAG: 23S rRNA (adenine(2503)-C(2))-methyltransferase RlmN [Bacteroidales bacterium]|nr:23S rRNA (adenine(2503)-C(2))-methyltransferase RlmN [Bacteroidales bacterium]
MDRTPLLGMTPAQLKEAALQAGLPSFTGNQLARWLYVRRAESLEEMTDISKAGREKLSETYCVGRIKPIGSQISTDGTRKYIFPVGTNAVEAVMIPEADRKTLCVSSQAGCKMGCHFCMTGRQGFHGNLSAAEILSQFLGIDEAGSLTNAVFMGMGEPLDNWEEVKKAIEVLCAPWGFGWSPKRITLSTIGVVPMLKRFLDESRCHLAVSLHNPFHEERLEMMPAEKAWPLESVIDLIKQYDFTGQRRVSFEYTVFDGWNDTPRHAQALIAMLRHLECRVNLIRFHSIPDFPYKAASATKMEDFRGKLERGGITATIRASRGEDIMAACGLLAGSLCHTEASPSVSQTPPQR